MRIEPRLLDFRAHTSNHHPLLPPFTVPHKEQGAFSLFLPKRAVFSENNVIDSMEKHIGKHT